MTTIKAECNTDDLMMLVDAARAGHTAMLILATADNGPRICLTAVQSLPNGKGPGRPRSPKAQTAGAAVPEPA